MESRTHHLEDPRKQISERGFLKSPAKMNYIGISVLGSKPAPPPNKISQFTYTQKDFKIIWGQTSLN
jgi:hypothetical protein